MSHLDTDVLAEFRAGLITGRQGAEIAAHLAGCDRCTAVDDQLAGVSVLLASVPAPAMPDSVAQRLDAALAAEVAERNDPERTGPEPSREARRSPRRARHRGFRLPSPRVLAPVAVAAAVVLAGGGYALSRIASPAGQVASSAAGSAPSVAGSAEPAAGAAAGQEPAASPLKRSARSQGLNPPDFPFVTSGENFSPALGTLRQQVAAALRAAPAAGSGQAVPAQVLACVQRLAGRDRVLLAESARFGGQPATLIVARTGQGEKAWVAGPGCARVLVTTSLLPGISGP